MFYQVKVENNISLKLLLTPNNGIWYKTPMKYEYKDAALQEAVRKVGGLEPLAKACGVSVQAISKWRSVPPHHVLTVSRVAKVSRYRLRPDIYGDRP